MYLLQIKMQAVEKHTQIVFPYNKEDELMTMIKRALGILLSCLMLMCMLSVGVLAAGTQDNPIDAATKWFGYGVDTYLLNPSIAAGSDGIWYTLTAEKEGVLALEHKYKDVDYTITITVDGKEYVGGSVDGVIYNGPIMTLPMQVGDVATIAIVTKDAAAGTVYASMNVFAGDVDNTIKVKSEGIDVWVAAGETVYFQDDSLQASYATKGLLVKGNVADTTFYNVTKNSESGAVMNKPVVDSDQDGIIEVTLGGSAGGAGAPAIKPAWAIENNSAEDQCYTLTIVSKAHECVYDDATDADCNSCGAVREVACPHAYDHDFDDLCNLCSEPREVVFPLSIEGTSISEDVNGLAWLIKADVNGIALMNGHEINYTNATVGQYKLIKMGAVATNNYAKLGRVPTLEDVNDRDVLNIEAKYLFSFNEDGTVTYAVRIINIPDEGKNTDIHIVPYFIFENDAGQQLVQYGNSASNAYNSFLYLLL